VILLIVLSNFVFHFWIGNKISINFLLVACLGVYAIIYNWNNIFAYFINGVSKIRLQLYSCIFAGIINIPISYVFAKFTNFGVASIVIANALCLLISSVWSPFQCYKLVSKKASGIWDK
jgi:Na+-driven multidrug efflux pump